MLRLYYGQSLNPDVLNEILNQIFVSKQYQMSNISRHGSSPACFVCCLNKLSL